MSAKIKIMIVEDSATQAEQLRHVLEANGYEVDATVNGREALTRLAASIPSLIISDVMMPEMDGFELCKKVKTDDKLKHLPVILLTMLSEPEDVIKGLACQADNFLTKPFSEKVLIERIQYMLANAEMKKGPSSNIGIEIVFAGRKHVVNSNRFQILDLLLSVYETAMEKHRELEKIHLDLKEAQEKITTLSGLIPICAKCKKIRNSKGYWSQVEEYVSDHTETVFSHGLCVECTLDAYVEMNEYFMKRRVEGEY